jgi:hypothetical protein
MAANTSKKSEILALTNISNGTLLRCCRQSSTFNSIDSTYDELNTVRQEWIDYLGTLSITFATWVEAWLAFTHFKQSRNCPQ